MSITNSFTVKNIFIAWLLLAFLVMLAGTRRRKFFQSVKNIISEYVVTRQILSRTERTLLAACILLGSITFLVAVIATPNNWDSMTYHLPRIVFWLQQKSLSHFYCHDFRMLFNPPLAELAQSHLLAFAPKTESAMNLAQWIAYVISILAVSLVAKEAGSSRRGQLWAAFLTASFPPAILQASTTQNDLIMLALLTSSIAFGLKAMRDNNISSWLFFALSAGLALCVKGTAFLFVPFAVALPLLSAIRHKYYLAVILSLIIILPSIGWTTRNYSYFGHIFGYQDQTHLETKQDIYRNQHFSPLLTTYAVLRNLSLLSATPVPVLNAKIQQTIEQVGTITGISPDDRRITWPYSKFHIPTAGPHEDLPPVLLHFMLTIMLGIWTVARFRYHHSTKNILWLLILFTGMLASCAYVIWMPWNLRFLGFWLLLMATFSIPFIPRLPWIMLTGIFVIMLLQATICGLFSIPRSLCNMTLKTKAQTVIWTSIFEEDIYRKYMAGQPSNALALQAITTKTISLRPSSLSIVNQGADSSLYPVLSTVKQALPNIRFQFVDPDLLKRLSSRGAGTANNVILIIGNNKTLPPSYTCLLSNSYAAIWVSSAFNREDS